MKKREVRRTKENEKCTNEELSMNAKSVNQIIIRTMWICSATISVLSCLLRGWMNPEVH